MATPDEPETKPLRSTPVVTLEALMTQVSASWLVITV
ncbi:protein of unknown function [Agrobacterium pusense]|uniref:Uncharacterized protein n=1 Tax=Agrobacterium pusense TaxID=648995 RepID=U4Q0M2_9HYPH|nr:protein of unknown function [Agrobacterium pusense]